MFSRTAVYFQTSSTVYTLVNDVTFGADTSVNVLYCRGTTVLQYKMSVATHAVRQ